MDKSQTSQILETSEVVKIIAGWRPKRGEKSRMARVLRLVPAAITRAVRMAEVGKETVHSRKIADYIVGKYNANVHEAREAVWVVYRFLEGGRRFLGNDYPIPVATILKATRILYPSLTATDDEILSAVRELGATIVDMFTGDEYLVARHNDEGGEK